MRQLEELIQNYYGDLHSERWKACVNAMPKSTSCIDCFQRQYFNGNKISYDCDQKRKIYVLRYLPVHQMEVFLALASIPPKINSSFLERNSLSFLSIGSGPGSDIIAFKRLIGEGVLSADNIAKIVVNYVEIETGWDGIVKDAVGLFAEDQRYSYQELYRDFSAEGFECDLNFDYVVLSYLVSELGDQELHNTSRNLQSCIRTPSVLIINDINEEKVVKKIKRLIKSFN